MIPDEYEVIDVISHINWEHATPDYDNDIQFYQAPPENSIYPHNTEIVYRHKYTGEITKLILTVVDRKWIITEQIDPTETVTIDTRHIILRKVRPREILD